MPDDQIPRFARLGVAACMQPAHAIYARADDRDECSCRLGPERAAAATMVLGSD
ncbi:hypothetical protein [Streptomyces canus]|uniref:hypothetical protein n=1 Tax=Streptomyces canus TaxID=58343 RepID=UPI00371BD699